jgi:Na+/phosphate symporter
MSSIRGTYSAALRITMRNTADAYGYALSTAATLSALTEATGKPGTGKLFLFVIGGVIAFVLLEALLAALGTPAPQPPERAIPFAGALNAASVCAALGMAVLIAHLVQSSAAWFLAQLSTTAIYLVVEAVQVTIAAAVQRRGPGAGQD